MKLEIDGKIIEVAGTPAEMLARVTGRDVPLPVRGGWGSSHEDAVVMSAEAFKAQGASFGLKVSVEAAYLQDFFQFEVARRRAAGEALIKIDYKMAKQELGGHEGRIFDRLLVVSRDQFASGPAEPTERTFFFDLTETFGGGDEEPELAPAPAAPAPTPTAQRQAPPTPLSAPPPPTAPPPVRSATSPWVVGAISGAVAAAATALLFFTLVLRESGPNSEPEAAVPAAAAPADNAQRWVMAEDADFIRWQQPVTLHEDGTCTGGLYHYVGSGFSLDDTSLEYDVRLVDTGEVETRYRNTGTFGVTWPGSYGNFRSQLYPYALLSTRNQLARDVAREFDVADAIASTGFEVIACRITAFLVTPI